MRGSSKLSQNHHSHFRGRRTGCFVRHGAVAKRWKVRMLPISFVIDRQGAIRYQLVGEANWTGPDVAPVIERLIGAGAKSQSASTAQ